MKLPIDKPILINITSDPAQLPIVRAAAEKLCELLGATEEVTGQIVLSLDEALANIIKHAYDSQEDQPIEVELRTVGEGEPRTLQLRLRDYGRRVDPSKIRSRELHDVRPGGLGVHIINEYMDSIEYEPAEGGGTVLTMLKVLDTEDNNA